LILVTCLIAGCSPNSENPSARTTTWQDGDNREVWSRCGPIAGSAEDCLGLARRYADGTQSIRPVCIGEIGGEQDEQVNNAWLTLGPNGADRAVFEQFRARRLARFQSAVTIANDPGAHLGPTETQLFRDEFADCWDTYSSLRGLNASPKARDAFLTYMELAHPNP
jgi:hypothetical protein